MQAVTSSASSGRSHRAASCCSRPMSSPVSSKMHAAPFSMSLSNALPAAGFPVRPLVASDPPQIVPMMRSEICMGTLGVSLIWSIVCVIQSTPFWMVVAVPPFCWMTSVCAGLPDSSMCFCNFSRLKDSQPRESSSVPATFGCVQICDIILSAYSFG